MTKVITKQTMVGTHLLLMVATLLVTAVNLAMAENLLVTATVKASPFANRR